MHSLQENFGAFVYSRLKCPYRSHRVHLGDWDPETLMDNRVLRSKQCIYWLSFVLETKGCIKLALWFTGRLVFAICVQIYTVQQTEIRLTLTNFVEIEYIVDRVAVSEIQT